MATLHELAQRRGAGQLHDSKFLSAEEKRKVLKQWELFLESGLRREKFTKSLYEHLINHCSFIAHYDIHGFYSTYFESGDNIAHFLSQFDDREGIPESIEYGMTGWITDEDYYDVNSEMVRIASKYTPALLAKAGNDQLIADVNQAQSLLAKHGIKVEVEDSELKWRLTFDG